MSRSQLETQAHHLIEQGIRHYQSGKHQVAAKSWENALVLYQQIDHAQAEAQTLNKLGNVYNTLGQYQKAQNCHQQQLSIAQKLSDRLEQSKAYSGLGNSCYSLGQYHWAIDYYQRSLAIARELNDRLGMAVSLGNLGNAHEALEQYLSAVDAHQQALALFEELNDSQGKANSLGNLGLIHYSKGLYLQALDEYRQAFSLFEQLGDRYQQAAVLTHLGNTHTALGNYPDAVTCYMQSLALSQELENAQGKTNTLNNLGNAYYYLGNYQMAIEYHRQALTIAQSGDDRRGEANALTNLGNDYDALGQYLNVVHYHQQALAIFREIGEGQGEATTLHNLGAAYASLGQFRKAIEYYQKSLIIEKEIGNQRGEVQSFSSLGAAYDSLEQYQEAIDCHSKQLELARELGDRRGEASALSGLGNAYDTLSQYHQAIQYHQQALVIHQAIGNPQGESNCLNNIGRGYYFLEQYHQAIDYHQQSLALARTLGDRKGEGTSLNNLGISFYQIGQLEEAEHQLRQAMHIWESLRVGLTDTHQISLIGEQVRIYYLLQLVLIGQGKTRAALEIAERGRNRTLAELLSQRLAGSETRPVSVIPLTLQQIQQICQIQNATLVNYSIAYDYFDIDSRKQVREATLLIWVIQPNGDIIFRSIDLKPLWMEHKLFLYNLILNTYTSLSGTEEKQQSNNIPLLFSNQYRIASWSQWLYQLLIQPIAELLPNSVKHSVIFIPQDSLFLIPFAALQDLEGNFLIERFTIQIAPSIQAIELTRQRRELLQDEARRTTIQPDSALVVGNPIMPVFPLSDLPQPLDPLPGTAAEAQAVANLLHTSAVTGSQATKAYVLQHIAQARLIHFATHGVWEDGRLLGLPEVIAERAQGAIALAPTQDDNGFFSAGEVLNLTLQAELVVLSACVTGLGKLSGDGVIGLSRSFIAAGVPSVIVSLWSVSDESTLFLMVKLYQNLQLGFPVGYALNEAQRWLKTVTKVEFERWIKKSKLSLSPAIRTQLRRRLHQLQDDDNPFYEAFHWAAFCAIGQ